jgi:hypothetical protein
VKEDHTTTDYNGVITELNRRAYEEDDLFAYQCLAVISLIHAGWRNPSLRTVDNDNQNARYAA